VKPQYFFIQTKQPKGDDLGAVEEAYFFEEAGEVVLCDVDGAGLRGEHSRRKLKPGEDPRRAAVSLLRAKVSRKSSDFNRKIVYEPWRI
jgi:hypothetical protein